MARRLKAQEIRGNCRCHAIEVACEAGASLQTIDQSEHTGAFHQVLRIASNLARERDKDAMNLRLFLFNQADQLVVLLDSFKRLNIDRLSRRTGAVDDSADTPLELAAHRYDKSVPANGDEIFLG